MPLPEPVTTNEKVPRLAVLDALTVRVDEAEPFSVVRLNDGVTPAGRPLTERSVVPLNPSIGRSEMTYCVLPPLRTVWLVGDAANAKSPIGVVVVVVVVVVVGVGVVATVAGTVCGPQPVQGL